MDQTDISSIILALDHDKDIEATREHLVDHGAQALPEMIDHFPKLKTWRARNAIVYTAIKFARRSENAKKLCSLGLQDKSKRVRQTACALAAFSLDRDFLPELEAFAGRSDPETTEDAFAAINAIQKQNHHLFMDRQETGHVTWNVMGSSIEP
ncbi:MAG: hypothetical protein AAF530_25875 [Pseudomonadota bacterium]